MAQTAKQDTEEKRKSVEELGDTISRSGEKLVDDLGSSLVAWAEAGGDIALGALKIAVQAAETGADKIKEQTDEVETQDTPLSGPARLLNSYTDTMKDVVRVHVNTASEAVNLVEDALDRVLATDDEKEAKAS